MNNKEFSKYLENRTRSFALSIFRFSSKLPSSPEIIIVRKQLCRSASSVGANYREANRARSLADFKSKIGICESEASETCYWLELLTSLLQQQEGELKKLHNEANEILAIFTSIGRNIKMKS